MPVFGRTHIFPHLPGPPVEEGTRVTFSRRGIDWAGTSQPVRLRQTGGMVAMTSREERYEAAEALKNSGDLAGAVAALEGVVAEHPEYALAHSALAAWCTRLDRHDEAVKHARRVCELEPKDP